LSTETALYVFAIPFAISGLLYVIALRRARGALRPDAVLPPAASRKQNLRNLPMGIGIVVLCGLIAILGPRCNNWGRWAGHPPTVEHRSELLEITSPQFHCPVDQLVISPEGDIGARVTGCGSNTHLCWRQPARHWKFAWLPCE
jgi:hypothetical protein